MPPRKIAVLAMFKDVGTYLKEVLLPCLDTVATKDPETTKYTFYFLENDSKDDTRNVLNQFFQSHDGQLFTLDNVQTTDKYPPDSIGYARISHFSRLRNHLLDATRDKLKAADYVCILDADIHIYTDVFADLMRVLDTNEDIVMVAPYLLEYTNKAKLSNVVGADSLAHIPDNKIFSVGHNYDTFALQYVSDETITWPFCRFERCQLCSGTSMYKVESTAPLVDVLSCFNGMILIKGEAFAWPLQYSTVNFAGKIALCEHVLFCHDIRRFTGKRIVIAQDVVISMLIVR
jgi:GT2 family glycosyltransferase